MALVCPDEGELVLIQYLLNKSAPSDPILHLFKNDVSPSEDTTIDDLEECDAAGYAEKILTGANWTVAQVEGTTSAIYEEQSFVFTEATNIYGYYVTSGSGDLLWLERFAGAPFQYPEESEEVPAGGTLLIVPYIELA